MAQLDSTTKSNLTQKTAQARFASMVKSKKPAPSIKIPKHFQCEKELLLRRNIVTLPESEAVEGQGFVNNLLFGKLKVSLLALRKQIEQGKINEDSIDSHLRHYLKKEDTKIYQQHLLSIAQMCIKQARVEKDRNTQLPLLFKAIDLLRMYIQYSEEAVDVMASNVIIHIFSTFPDEFSEKWALEQEVFRHYVELHKTKRRVKDIGFGDKENVSLRTKIALLSAQQKNYYDAFVQFSNILTFYQFRTNDDPQVVLNRAKSHAWIGNVFQELIHYVQPGEATILKNFVYRYNRDHATRKNDHPIAIVKRNDAIALKQTKKDLIRLANEQYEAVEKLGAKIGNVGYRITDGVIAGLSQENLKPHLLKTAKALRGMLYNSKAELAKAFKEQSNPPPNAAQLEKIWVHASSESGNIQQGAMLQLKRNNKWISVYFQSMTRLAKNYEFLDMGDEALKYAKVAYQIMEPVTDRRYFEQKRSALNYLKDLYQSSNLRFRKISKKQFQEEAILFREKAFTFNETFEKQARDRHLAAARLAR